MSSWEIFLGGIWLVLVEGGSSDDKQILTIYKTLNTNYNKFLSSKYWVILSQ